MLECDKEEAVMERKLKYSEDYYVRVLLNKVPLREVMTEKLFTIREGAPFHEVADKIMKNSIRHLPVVDKDNKLIGLMTERDLHKIQSPRRLEDGTWYYDQDSLDSFILRDVMIPNPFTLKPENTVAEAILKMVQKKYGCILIVDNNNTLCGIVSYVDLLKLAAQILEEK